MEQQIYQVDAFTDRPFAGNPAAVCPLDAPRSEAWMQNVAAEMNLAETAFLLPQEDGWNLRWFTPLLEVDLCGHATLAAAHILWETERLAPDAQARFRTRSGLLTARRRGEWIELDFPAERETPTEASLTLFAALGARPRYVGKNRFDLIAELEDEAAVRALKPDFVQLALLPVRGVIITARADSPDYDFVSRFFAPQCGIPEDPVTGSAHCCLGPFWSARLNKTEMTAFQASARGGHVQVSVRNERVLLGGKAVTVLRGALSDRASV
jgi:predicted PhzF superfamily epimerase YddE/YHI9